ncbi:MAG: permease [Pseudomonadales bacterium]
MSDSNDCEHAREHEAGHGHGQHAGDHCQPSGRRDYLLWCSALVVTFLYLHFALAAQSTAFAGWYHTLSHAVFELVNTMWWGVALGILMLALLTKIPRQFVMSALGTGNGARAIVRAAGAGVLLDLCSHGILMVAAKLYERGASVGQVMAFLIASPWNSFSLTLVLFALIGLPWTLAFIALSMLVAIVTGLFFEWLCARGVLPANPASSEITASFRFWPEARKGLAGTRYSLAFFRSMLVEGIRESRMVLRWILFGIVLASLVRAFVSPEQFGTYFGPTLAGLGLTVLVATVLEVCSEGSTPIAADLLTRAQAPGNSFAFLMTGVATDYTEIMVLKETTRSWKIALFLPLISVPQVLVIAWLMNYFA